jgi:UDP-N-acetylmuramoyl-L-alanyl-D-glutamate--2,6-diaminopimelate ligase
MSAVGGAEMDLRQLLAGMNGPLPALDVSDIATHSGEVMPGALFLACPGTHAHGLRFLSDALARGASAVAWEPAPGLPPPTLPAAVAGIAVPELRRHLGDIANRFFAQPSAVLSVSGITGTNGKTTVAWLVTQALGRLGRCAGYIGTLGHGIGTRVVADVLTTPGCITMHRHLRELAAGGASHVVTEVSSHALDQGRVDGVHFRVAAFTNLTRDHLDYHGDLDAYRRAKARLFLECAPQQAVINVGDAYGRELAGRLPAGTRLISVAAGGDDAPLPEAALTAQRISGGPAGQRIRLRGTWGEAELSSPLWGAFNTENLGVAAGILLAEGFTLDETAGALAGCDAPPGRMERIGPGRPAVVVDFAHTPDALRRVLLALRQHASGSIWCVFGCGGERDPGKRPLMGQVAEELADQVVVTSDNPRGEDPMMIIENILAGLRHRDRAKVEPDRAKAIAEAIRKAGKSDVILIAGKGHETYQEVAGRRVPFSDRDVVRGIMTGKVA